MTRRGPGRLGVAATVLALVVGAGGGWAARSLLSAPAPLPAAASAVVATATEDTVERTLALDAKATWSGGAQVSGALPGTVTRARARGATRVTAGQALYDVDLVPVVVAEGRVPAFRDLRKGDTGADVSQLQRLLREVTGVPVRVDGTFRPGLTAVVKRWQRDLGVRPTGVVARGSVLFVPSLPAVVSLATEVRVGAVAPVGVPAVKVLPASPSFTIQLPSNQASLTKAGMQVLLTHGSARWKARVIRLGPRGDDGSVLASLGPAKGATSVCGTTCRTIPVGGATVPAAIQVVPRTTGVTVPTQALVVGPAGGAAVVDSTGQSVPVTVKAAVGGVAVVDGLAAGREVRVPSSG